jgi:hypothetical protein
MESAHPNRAALAKTSAAAITEHDKGESFDQRALPERADAPAGLERAFTIAEIVSTGVACRAKLYADIKAGRLKAKKFGRSTRILESAYREYLESAPTLGAVANTPCWRKDENDVE